KEKEGDTLFDSPRWTTHTPLGIGWSTPPATGLPPSANMPPLPHQCPYPPPPRRRAPDLQRPEEEAAKDAELRPQGVLKIFIDGFRKDNGSIGIGAHARLGHAT